MNGAQRDQFSRVVGERLSSEEARELWEPVAQEFDRNGPDAAREFLNAEKQRLEEQVRRLLDEFERQR